jgi:hypothetical protein
MVQRRAETLSWVHARPGCVTERVVVLGATIVGRSRLQSPTITQSIMKSVPFSIEVADSGAS